MANADIWPLNCTGRRRSARLVTAESHEEGSVGINPDALQLRPRLRDRVGENLWPIDDASLPGVVRDLFLAASHLEESLYSSTEGVLPLVPECLATHKVRQVLDVLSGILAPSCLAQRSQPFLRKPVAFAARSVVFGSEQLEVR